jgi:hypothetical protein
VPGPVPDPAPEQQQGAEREGVPGDDPLQVRRAKCSSRLMVGSAMFTMLKSSCSTNWAASDSLLSRQAKQLLATLLQMLHP